ncbi:MAG: hypothetical protein P1U56_07940 [Saprospiraceae bacterium]|nr:hypothetical protein [Saprospiraceae bacterium]
MSQHAFILILGCLFIGICCSPKSNFSNQTIPVAKTIRDSTNIQTINFPREWVGNWEGNLSVYNAKGKTQVIQMGLNISPSDSIGTYNWTILYGQDSMQQIRNYLLKTIDESVGHYLIDEKNGILLDAFFIHNELKSIFDVMGNTLIVSYKLEKKNILFMVEVFPSKEIRTSGDTIINSLEIPKVKSYQHTTKQLAHLQKKYLVE